MQRPNSNLELDSFKEEKYAVAQLALLGSAQIKRLFDPYAGIGVWHISNASISRGVRESFLKFCITVLQILRIPNPLQVSNFFHLKIYFEHFYYDSLSHYLQRLQFPMDFIQLSYISQLKTPNVELSSIFNYVEFFEF